MSVSAEEVKKLRDKTGSGLMDCKKALQEAEGDMEKAMQVLRQKGLAKAKEKSSREASEGVIGSYVHANDKIGVLVEVRCETDFVARNEQFRELVDEIAMQVAAMDPDVVSREDFSEEKLEEERQVYREQFQDKPDDVIDRIVEGKMEDYFSEVCLMDQPYIRDDDKTIKELVDEAVAKIGENIEVRRFERMELGETEE